MYNDRKRSYKDEHEILISLRKHHEKDSFYHYINEIFYSDAWTWNKCW